LGCVLALCAVVRCACAGYSCVALGTPASTRSPAEVPPMFACDFAGCNFVALRQCYVVGHKRVHEGLRVYACDVPECSAHFTNPKSLKVHARWHSGEKPYACAIPGCMFQTATETRLQAHKMRHAGVKSHVCDFAGCSYMSVTRSGLVVHARSAHNIVPARKVQLHKSRLFIGGED